ncbi:MAG: outer membrane beta-barrel protein [Cyclobacteriaceae bacterium]|nr:outer membrane beta-barrel protein [Cyclobacteriaceae bacterium]
MKKVNFQISSFLILFWVMGLLGTPKALAQKYEIGGGLGTTAYTGDILRKIDLDHLGLHGTLFGKRNFDNVWSLRVGISAGTLRATDSVRPLDLPAERRDARFRGGVLEGSAVMEFNFLDFLRNDSEFFWSPYAFFGIGYSHFFMKGNTFAYNASEGYNLGSVVIPFGGGIKYRINDRWTLQVEAGIRATFTDYIDKIDGSTPPIPRFQDPANPDIPYGINFGNPYDKDWYYFLGVSLSYTIQSTKCYAY